MYIDDCKIHQLLLFAWLYGRFLLIKSNIKWGFRFLWRWRFRSRFCGLCDNV